MRLLLNEFHSPWSYSYEMTFCRGEVVPEYIDRASPFEAWSFIGHSIDLIEDLIVESEIKSLHVEIISSKSILGRDRIKSNSNAPDSLSVLINRHIHFIQIVRRFDILIGKCHDDLILSNIIFVDFNDRYFLKY